MVAAAILNLLLRTDNSQIFSIQILAEYQDLVIYDLFTAEDERNFLTTPHKQFKATNLLTNILTYQLTHQLTYQVTYLPTFFPTYLQTYLLTNLQGVSLIFSHLVFDVFNPLKCIPERK